MRKLCCGLLLAAVGVGPAAAQSSAQSTSATSNQTQTTNTETRPALPTYFGDTGIWFVPTGETLSRHKASGQILRADWTERQRKCRFGGWRRVSRDDQTIGAGW